MELSVCDFFVWIVTGLIIYFLFKTVFKTVIKCFTGKDNVLTLSKDEKSAFQQMMLSPSDEAVAQYISVLKRFAEFVAKTGLSKSIAVGEQIKYVNAYNIISNSDNVSKELKEELYRCFLAIGIPLSK